MYRAADSFASNARMAISRSQRIGSKLGWSRNCAGKDIRFGAEACPLMLKRVEDLTDAVKVTTGLKGGNIVIEQSFGAPKVTKDSVTIAKSIEFKDRVKNMGASLVKQVTNATNDVASDGIACAPVLTRAIFAKGCKSVVARMTVMDLRRGITMAVDAAITNLKSRVRMISTSEEIAKVGTILANGEREIDELIVEGIEKVDKEGVITIADEKTLDDELEVVEGMKLDRGCISPHFITDQKNQKCDSIATRHELWMATFGRTYKDEAEKRQRLEIFRRNVKFVEDFNRRGEYRYTIGLNMFADFSEEELENMNFGVGPRLSGCRLP